MKKSALLLALPTLVWANSFERGITRAFLNRVPQDRPPVITHRAPDPRPFERWRSYKQITNVSFRHGQKTVESVANMDADGFRVNPFDRPGTMKKQHLIFGGCSWTFGTGVSDAEAFPSVLAQLRPHDEVHNLGIQGGGVNEQNYLWRYGDFSKRVHSPKGLYAYVYMPFQHERFQRVPSYYHWTSPMIPRFVLRDHDIEFAGVNGDDWLFGLTRFFVRNGLIKQWLQFYSWFEPRHLANTHDEMARHLSALKRSYLKQYPQGRFVVIPGNLEVIKDHSYDSTKFSAALERHGIEYWELGARPAGPWLIDGDGHPNAEFHWLMAERLNEKIDAVLR